MVEGRQQPGRVIPVFRLGILDYEQACRLQEQVAAARAADATGDLLLLVEHPPVITVGRGGGQEDILASEDLLQQQGIRVLPTDRGGKATYHGPGQLVVYPIFRVSTGDLHDFVWRLEEAVIQTLAPYGLTAGRLAEYPGVWIGGQKIAAIGLAVRDGITRHGLALNVDPQMDHFGLLIPCGIADRGVTSMSQQLRREARVAEVTDSFVRAFARTFHIQVEWQDPDHLPGQDRQPVVSAVATEQPSWLWKRISGRMEEAVASVEHLLSGLGLHTVCQEARCPNIADCFGQGTATFLILGDRCTRGCRFCAVAHGRPASLDPEEPGRVAEAAARLGLRYVVVTSVTRDDLSDGGAGQFAATVRAIQLRMPRARTEVLVPDLDGSVSALETALAAQPDVLNHNLETVPRLYPRARPGANYQRSLGILASAKVIAPGVVTKSGLMLGLGERTAEVVRVLHDLRAAGCDLLTLGQYLQPSDDQLPVARYVTPEEFGWYRDKARALGFQGVASGPLVRSSHQAEALWLAGSF
jgi:lipoic acid synthetase